MACRGVPLDTHSASNPPNPWGISSPPVPFGTESLRSRLTVMGSTPTAAGVRIRPSARGFPSPGAYNAPHLSLAKGGGRAALRRGSGRASLLRGGRRGPARALPARLDDEHRLLPAP